MICMQQLQQKELLAVNGGALSWATVGGLAGKAAIGAAAATTGVAIGVGIVASVWYVLDHLDSKKD